MKLLKSAALLSLALFFTATAHANTEKECMVYNTASSVLKEEIKKRGWDFENSKALCKKLNDNNAMLYFLDDRTITSKESIAAVMLTLADKKLMDKGMVLTNGMYVIRISRSPVRSEQAERDLTYTQAMTAINSLTDRDFDGLNNVRQKLKQFDPKKPLPVNAFSGDDGKCQIQMMNVNKRMSDMVREYGFDEEYGFNQEHFDKNCKELSKRKAMLFTNGFHSTNSNGTVAAVFRLQQPFEYQIQGIPMFTQATQTALYTLDNEGQAPAEDIENYIIYKAINGIISDPLSANQLNQIDNLRKVLPKQ